MNALLYANLMIVEDETLVAFDLAVLERNVEVDAGDDPFTLDAGTLGSGEVFDEKLGHNKYPWLRFGSLQQRCGLGFVRGLGARGPLNSRLREGLG